MLHITKKKGDKNSFKNGQPFIPIQQFGGKSSLTRDKTDGKIL